MAISINFYKGYLSQQLNEGTAASTIYVDRITTADGQTVQTADFAEFGRGIITINPDGDGSSSYPECASFTGVNSSTVAFTGTVRGLDKDGVTDTDLMRYHPVGTPVVISFGVHNLQDFKDYIDDEIAAATIGTANVVTGTAGETVAAGNLVYLNTDGKWWLTDADTAATVSGVQLGIAQGAGTANNTITGGVMRKGRDANQTGLTPGSTYYASNTAGGISTSAGTNSRVVGVARSTTELYFDPDYGIAPSIGEKAAMAGGGDLGTPSSANKFLTESAGVTKGKMSLNAGATINGATLPVPVYQNKSDNEVYACDGNDLTALKFIGFAISNSTDGNPITVQFNGIVSGFTGLTEGEKYYLSDTVGTIQNSPGTYEVLVGIAVSETQLVIQRGRRFMNGYFTPTETATNRSIDCGFRPNVIRMTAYRIEQGATPSGSDSTGSWRNGVYSCITRRLDTTDSVIAPYTDKVGQLISASGDTMSYTISSVTDTGFTFTETESGTYSLGAGGSNEVYWEAEGEL